MKLDKMIADIVEKDIVKFNTEIQEEMDIIIDSVSTILNLALEGYDTDDEDEVRRVFGISDVEVLVDEHYGIIKCVKCKGGIEVCMKPGSSTITVVRLDENGSKTYAEHSIDSTIIKTPKKKFDKLLEKVKTVNPYYACKCMPNTFDDMVWSILHKKLHTEYSIEINGSYEFPPSYEGDIISFGIRFSFIIWPNAKDHNNFNSVLLNTKEG